MKAIRNMTLLLGTYNLSHIPRTD